MSIAAIKTDALTRKFLAVGRDGKPLPLRTHWNCQAVSAGTVFHEEASGMLAELISGFLRVRTQIHITMEQVRPITRIEFVYRAKNELRLGARGAVFFDDDGEPVLHVVNASISDDSGMEFAKQIVGALGVSEQTLLNLSAPARTLQQEGMPYAGVLCFEDGVWSQYAVYF